MATKVLTGIQGGGKTLYCIKQCLDRYFTWDSKYDEWIPKKIKDKFGKEVEVTIWTNIEGFKLPHIQINDYFLKHDLTVESFFCEEYAEKIVEQYGVNVFILDEAQKFFPSEMKKSRSVAFWHEYHRHWGFDIYYITQSLDKLSSHAVWPIEVEIRAVKPMYRLLSNRYKYKLFSDGQQVGTKSFNIKPIYFTLYKSQKVVDTGTTINPVRNLLILALCLIVGVFWSGYHQISQWAKPKTAQASALPAPGAKRSVAKEQAKPKPPSLLSSLKESTIKTEKNPTAITVDRVVPVRCGVAWVGESLVSVQIYGELYKLADIPYSYTVEGRAVTVYIPESDIPRLIGLKAPVVPSEPPMPVKVADVATTTKF